MSNTPYKQEAENWAAAWGGYYKEINHYQAFSTVCIRKNDRLIRVWFDSAGQQTARIDENGILKNTDEHVGELKEWIDGED